MPAEGFSSKKGFREDSFDQAQPAMDVRSCSNGTATRKPGFNSTKVRKTGSALFYQVANYLFLITFCTTVRSLNTTRTVYSPFA